MMYIGFIEFKNWKSTDIIISYYCKLLTIINKQLVKLYFSMKYVIIYNLIIKKKDTNLHKTCFFAYFNRTKSFNLIIGWPFWNICVTNDHGYVPLVVNTSRSFPHSWLITGCVTRLTRRVPLVEQELITLPEHLSSPPVFSRVRVTRSLVLCVCLVDRCLSFYTFSFGHCVVCSSSIYGF
jgi:hypothetical protein